jgi:hypothetical protein
LTKITAITVFLSIFSIAHASAQESQFTSAPSAQSLTIIEKQSAFAYPPYQSAEHMPERSQVFTCTEMRFVHDPDTNKLRQANCFVPELFSGFLIAAPPGTEMGNWTRLRPE